MTLKKTCKKNNKMKTIH